MKKLIYTLLITAFTLSVKAQNVKGNNNIETQTRELETYQEIEVIGSLKANLVSGTEGSIKITTDSNLLEYVEAYVKHNKLILKMKDRISYNSKKGIVIEIPVQDIEKLSLLGSGDIIGNYTLTDKNLNLTVNGSGDIKLDAKSETIIANVAGSGDITLTGTTNKLTATVTGSGDIDAKKLKSNEANLTVNGSGDIASLVKTAVKANVNGSGDIDIYGKTEKVDKKVIGSGSISIK